MPEELEGWQVQVRMMDIGYRSNVIGTFLDSNWGPFYLDSFLEEILACGRRLGGLASSGSDDGYRSNIFFFGVDTFLGLFLFEIF